MKRKNVARNALVTSIISLLLCVSMLVGTTFAWFTDSVVSGSNIIKSGNLDVAMYWADGTEDVPTAKEDWTDASAGAIFNYNLWEPGYTEVRHIKIVNEGSLALKYNVSIMANGEVTNLSDVIDVYYMDPAIKVADRTQLSETDNRGNLSGVLSALGQTGNGTLEAGQSDTITIALKMKESAGNDYMNKSIGTDFSIVLVATQLTYEDDSFGNDYDEESNYPVYEQARKEDGKSVVVGTGDVKVQVPAAAPAGNYSIVVTNKNKSTDANGNTTLSMNIDLMKDGQKVVAAQDVMYNVSIAVDAGVNITTVNHNGVAVSDYVHSAYKGTVEFETNSFSPFSITYSKIVGLNPDANYLSTGTDVHNSSNKSGTFQMISNVKTSDYGDNSRYGYGYEYIIRNQADYTLDLNGKTITHDTVNENANHNALTYTFVANHVGTKLTINGPGKVVSHNPEGYTCAVQGKDGTLITINGGDYEVTNGIAVWAGAGSHIVINGGSFVNGGATTSHELVYSSGGVIDIYSGFFHNTDGNYTLNIEDRNRATGFINVYGGTFVNFDPSTGGQDPNNIKVAEGYTVVSETQANGDVWYTVVRV